jgi:hypothetical protein
MKLNKYETQQLKPVRFLKAIVFLVIVLILVTSAMKCQGQERFSPFVIVGGGLTLSEPSVELHAGAIYKKFTTSVGFNAVIDSGQPFMMQWRTGYLFWSRVHVYTGLVLVNYNSDDTRRNYATYHIGAQIHGVKYDNGTMYLTAGYSPGFPTIGAGMTFHFIKSPK